MPAPSPAASSAASATHAAPTALRLAGSRQAALGIARQRLVIGLFAVAAFTLLLGLRLIELALIAPPAPGARAAAPAAPRADIVDRNGVVLATTYRAMALAVRPHDVIGDRHALADSIHAILPNREKDSILAALNHPGRFTFIARRIMPEQAEALRALGEPGLILEREPERLYPHGALAAHLIGFTGIDGEGAMGIERAFEARLADPRRTDEPLVLSIDARVQQVLESELQHQKSRQNAEGAAGVVLDAQTGEVLAMASLPAFDANAPGGLAGLPSHMNRITLGVYELGSTFKPMTVAMGLEAGTIRSLAETYPTSSLSIGRHRIRDLHPKGRPLTVPEVLIYSSNVGTAKMAEALGQARQKAFLAKLGFLEPVPVEILEKGRTLYPDDSSWGLSSVLTIGFGHGLAVTPLHLASAYATLVNGGIRYPPTFLRRPAGRPVAGERVFKEEVSAALRAMLRAAVTEGTGRRADAPGYRVGGKTGTAEKPRPGGGYFRDRNITTFAGAFPMDAPRYIVVVMLDDPRGDSEEGGGRTAGATIAPAFRQVVLRIAPVLGVVPDSSLEPAMHMLAGLYAERPK
ncbi:peptidoglycan D,D-transpeptidase FtsI family protein [Thermaurantiacus sp.]